MIQIYKNCFFSKVNALINYYIVKIFSPKIIFGGISFVGKGCKMLCNSKGARIFVGKRSHFSEWVEVQSQGYLHIGDGFNINRYSRIICYDKITIGNNVVVAQFVSVLDHDHRWVKKSGNLLFEGYSSDPVSIGNNVWIADKVTILKGANIGNNVIIGANSVVKGKFRDNVLIAGSPAEVIREI